MSAKPFLIRMLALQLALPAMLLGGCVVTPAGNRDRIGDFVTNMASATPAVTSGAAALVQASRRKQPGA